MPSRRADQTGRVTIRHLARRLRVHPSTISLAMHDSPEVSAKMKRRVRALARRWCYTPNHLARSLVQRRTRNLGVVFPYATTPYYATLLDAVYQQATERGYHLEIRFHQWNPQPEIAAIQTLVERQVEGLILLSGIASLEDALRRHVRAALDLPVVLIGRPETKYLPRFARGYVSTDLLTGSRYLGEHLLAMGHRQVAILMTDRPRQNNPIATRLAGLHQAFRGVTGARLEQVALEDLARPDGGIAMVHKRGSPPYNVFLIGRQLAEKFLQLRPRPTAVVATDETIAHVALGVFHAHGIRVPRDVSVACYGGSYLSEYGAPPLTCVEQPVDDMARNALDLLLAPASSRRGAAPELRLLPPRLILRDSVAAPAKDRANGTLPIRSHRKEVA